MAPIKIGLIGLSAEGSWASSSHLPALLKSPHYQITALQNSTEASARKAVEKYNLPGQVACYGDVDSLVRDPNVDMVVVSVKTPEHYRLTKPALEAKKDVFVEWPLGANLKQAEELTALAKAKGVKHMIGLQGRQNPSVLKAKEMVAAGKLGDILGTTMFAYGVIMGPVTPVALEYELTFENGATLATIPTMHGTDALCFVLGEFKHLQATLANHRPKMPIVDPTSGKVLRTVDNDTPDQVSITGTLLNGAVATIVYQGGQSPTEKGLYWEIRGTKGSLIIEGPNGLLEMFPTTLKFVGQGGQPEEIETEVAADWAYNVDKAWDAFVSRGLGTVPTFEDALVRHRMIDAIHRSHEKGTREAYL
ncbi:hypothetical protein A1O7_09988 [Cladophialophora yegresii CBS 114405]|uniref:Gfo/Idh/MocA-like oxidoreductase N-terminal domain-containing protein n=1 Tax=Cladophialophora yegresii CBS 114405 TaxID=1182544 RepID=W9VG87_9EURO|nr:uncharacterized protein A1O7_09988 [Cladophialophora yegresii CBS 114405]EXJ54647.1 hypothetical protein A1O7_09988 [Cladophialophora yegresii CBS 114405]